MTLRTPDVEPSFDGLNEALQDHAVPWHTLHCELITPMYGGGVVSTKVDEHMPIRASSIRGQLRFWWRLLAKHKWPITNIAQAETQLWGGMGKGDDEGEASKVLLRVVNQSTVQKVQNNLQSYEKFPKLKYVLFPAANAEEKEINPHRLLSPEGIAWQLHFAFTPDCTDEQKSQVVETLKWWANFGGLGFRSRKGLGAVYVSDCADFPEICEILTADDVAQAGCQLVQKTATPNAMTALETAVGKLSDFRQKAGVGRNIASEEGQEEGKPAGRSYWSEPDAIRSITGKHLNLTEQNKNNRPRPIVKNHAPVHLAKKVFVRSVFGLPIIYKFMNDEYYDKKDPKDRGERRQIIRSPDGREPLQTTVNLAQGDRLASPLILRPVFAGLQDNKPQWKASALVLPYSHILQMEVMLESKDLSSDKKNVKYPIWNSTASQHIDPIKKNGGGDPLQAFLTYFAK